MFNVTIASEDSSEFANIMSEISTYVDEMKIKFVTGQVDLDSGFEEYMSTLDKMGIDRAKEIYQKALDEFNAR